MKLDFEKRAENNSRQINRLLEQLGDNYRDFLALTQQHEQTVAKTHGIVLVLESSRTESAR